MPYADQKRGAAIQMHKILQVGPWNVRSMLQPGKVQMLGRESEKHRVDLCELLEVR